MKRRDFMICNNEIEIVSQGINRGALLTISDELDCVELEIKSMKDALLLKGIVDEVINRLKSEVSGE